MRKMVKKMVKGLVIGGLVTLFAGCASNVHTAVNKTTLDSGSKWALLPLTNNTDTPQAALAAEAIVEHQLRLRGVASLQHYPIALSRDNLFEPSERKVVEEAKNWAKTQGIRFGVTGSVEEWRYKVGIDGEPAVGVSLSVLDLSNNEVVWSASGAKSGWSRHALSATAQSLLADMLGDLALANNKSGSIATPTPPATTGKSK
jgi:polysaccharide biosynthesis protein PelC